MLTVCDIEFTAKAPKKKGYPTNPVGYGEHMRKERLELRLTQYDLAQIFKVYKSTIDKWERGITEPNEYNKNQIIEFLGFDPIIN